MFYKSSSTLSLAALFVFWTGCSGPDSNQLPVSNDDDSVSDDDDSVSDDDNLAWWSSLCTGVGADSNEVVAVFAEGSTLRTLNAGGVSNPLLDFEGDTVIQRLKTAGEYVVVESRDALGEADLVVLHRDGTKTWSFSEDGGPQSAASSEFYLNPQGWLVVYPGNTSGWAIDPDGGYHFIAGAPVGPALSDGRVPVALSTQVDGLAWWSKEEGVFGVAEPSSVIFPALADDAILYQRNEDGALVLEGPSFVQVLDLVPPSSRQPALSPDSSWAASWTSLGSWEETWQLVRLDLVAGVSENVTLAPPAGFSTFPLARAEIDNDGGILLSLRSEGAGAVFRTMDGQSWEQVGDAFHDVRGILGSNRFGTSIVQVYPNIGSDFVDQMWGEPDPAFEPISGGSHYQLVGADGLVWDLGVQPALMEPGFVEMELGPGGTQVSPDGRCALYWDWPSATEARLRALDLPVGMLHEDALVDGDTFDRATIGQIAWFGF